MLSARLQDFPATGKLLELFADGEGKTFSRLFFFFVSFPVKFSLNIAVQTSKNRISLQQILLFSFYKGNRIPEISLTLLSFSTLLSSLCFLLSFLSGSLSGFLVSRIGAEGEVVLSPFLSRIMRMEKGLKQSNLDSFLHCTTPIVPSQFLPKSEIRNLNSLWHPWEIEKVEYFTLSDLWSCFDEWSAYGAGVPVVLSSGETVVQYYVPYLSAIQIFTSNSSLNSLREETDSGEGETRESFSDSYSEESKSDKLWRWEGCSSEDEGSDQECLWHLNDRLGYLYFQYFERSTPYGRVPLMDKINSLARRCPGLMSLRSVDLSPASWMAVAWYPIYHIPMGRTIKDLSACFLTYHTLSSSFQDMDLEDDIDGGDGKQKEREGICLPTFGMATYKMQGNVWVSGNGGEDQEKLLSLLGVADSWLKQLRVQHHDFNYFTGVRRG